MSFKFSKRCDRCSQLGFHPALNWHPMAPARRTHLLKHLRHDFDAFEKEEGSQLLQKSRIVCFPVQPETEDFRVCCFDCGGLFAKKDLVGHCLEEHRKKKQARVKAGRRTADKKNKKQQCPQSKKIVSDLHRHQRVHIGERPFPCHQCGKAFKRKDALKNHQRAAHNMHNPFICENCGKGFGVKRDMKRHLLAVHLKQKPFKCPECIKSFGLKGHLKQHQAAVHESLKPFSCGVCKHKFSLKWNLKIHQEAVHGKQKPFSCRVCKHKFGLKWNLKKHEEAVHGKQKPFLL